MDQLSQRSDGRNSPTRSSRHLDAEAAAQAAQRLVDERRLSVDTEVDRLQIEKDKRARERLFEDRDLERRLNRLLQEQQNTDSLERARIRDQQEFDNELAAERANSGLGQQPGPTCSIGTRSNYSCWSSSFPYRKQQRSTTCCSAIPWTTAATCTIASTAVRVAAAKCRTAPAAVRLRQPADAGCDAVDAATDAATITANAAYAATVSATVATTVSSFATANAAI